MCMCSNYLDAAGMILGFVFLCLILYLLLNVGKYRDKVVFLPLFFPFVLSFGNHSSFYVVFDRFDSSAPRNSKTNYVR